MLVVMRDHASQETIDHVVEILHEHGAEAHLSQGEVKTIIGVVGEREIVYALDLEGLPGGKPPTVFTPEQYEQARAGNKLSEFDVIVLDSYLPTMPKDSPSPLPPGQYLIMGAVLMASSVLVLGNLVADILLGIADPRIRHE